MSDAMGKTSIRSAGLFFAAVILASALALATATISARPFGILDCAACLYQLVPYAIAAVVAGMALVIGPGRAGYRGWAVACALVFAAGCVFILYREGVNEGWWSLAGVCGDLAPSLPGSRSATLLLDRPTAALCDADEISADEIAFATVNFLYSAVMAFACAVTAAVNDFELGDSAAGGG